MTNPYLPDQISNDSLTLSRIPDVGAPIEELAELRNCLFFEPRRWNHYGHAPDEEAMKSIRRLVAQIRAKVDTGRTSN
jgi:hypothetical protein